VACTGGFNDASAIATSSGVCDVGSLESLCRPVLAKFLPKTCASCVLTSTGSGVLAGVAAVVFTGITSGVVTGVSLGVLGGTGSAISLDALAFESECTEATETVAKTEACTFAVSVAERETPTSATPDDSSFICAEPS
jgi:hypothetical protein